MTVRDEVHEQPASIGRALRAAAGALPDVRDLLAGHEVAHVVLAARGTSDNAARWAQYLWGRRAGLPVALATPSLYADGSGPHLRDALVVGLSQSGASPDLVGVLAEARRQGRPTVAIVNDPGSALAEVADVTVPLSVGPERAVAATKTYTGELASAGVLTDALPGAAASVADELAGVPEAVARVLADADGVAPVVEALAGADRAMVVGRGLDLATSHEWALKLQELSGVLAHAWSTADLQHGPIALAEDGMPVLVVATDPDHLDEALGVFRQVRRRGARAVLLTDHPVDDDGSVVRLPPAGHLGGAFTAITAAQLATLDATRAAGRDPDRPRHLTKVTRTR